MSDLNFNSRESVEPADNNSEGRSALLADFNQVRMAQAGQFSSTDQFADYQLQTRQALKCVDEGSFNGLGVFYRQGDATEKAEIEGALKSVGITVTSDGKNMKLSLTDPNRPGEERNLTIGQFGKLTPELKTKDANLQKMYDSLTPKKRIEIWATSLQEKVKNRPQLRSA